MKNIRYALIKMTGSDRVTAILSNEREPESDHSVLDTNNIREAERMIDDRHYAYREEMESWEKTLKKFKVHSKHKEYVLKIARMFYEKEKKKNLYAPTFEEAIKDGIEIKPIYIEVNTDVKHCKGSNHFGEPCFFGKKGNTCDEDCEVKQFVVERKLTDIEVLKEELYTGSLMSDMSIDIVLDKIKRKGYEIVKK